MPSDSSRNNFNKENDTDLESYLLESEHLASSDFLMALMNRTKRKHDSTIDLEALEKDADPDVSVDNKDIIRIIRVLNLLSIEFFSYAFADSSSQYRSKEEQKLFVSQWVQQIKNALFKPNK